MQPPGGPPYPAPNTPPMGGGAFQPPPAGSYQSQARSASTSTEAILALVLSIVGFTSSCFPLSLAAIYFGMKARQQARDQGNPSDSNGTLGLVGIILGAVFGILWGLFWLLEGGIIIAAVVMAVVAGASGP